MSFNNVDFYAESYKNRENMKKSNGGQCYSCFNEISYTSVDEWLDSDLTAVCPKCIVDAIIPFNKLPSDTEECKDLMEMWHKKGFGETSEFNHEDNRKQHENSVPQYESDPDDGVIKTMNLFIDKTTKATSKKVGRNDPCPCGSGKKYKKCCVAQE